MLQCALILAMTWTVADAPPETDSRASMAWKEVHRTYFNAAMMHSVATAVPPLGGLVIQPLANDGLGVFLACHSETVPVPGDLRLYFVDADGNRHEGARNYGGGGPRGRVTTAFLFVTPEGLARKDVREITFEQFTKVDTAELEALRKREQRRLSDFVQDSPLPIPTVGKPYPFELTDLDGNEVSTDRWKGKVIVLDFWATWCSPCKAELPELKELYGKYHKRGFEVVGISFDRDRKALVKYIKKKEIPWPQVFVKDLGKKADKALGEVTGVRGIPRYFVIDRHGKLHTDRARGSLDELIPNLVGE